MESRNIIYCTIYSSLHLHPFLTIYTAASSLFIVFPHQTFYGKPILIVPKLYANTVYMVLNSRIQIMGGRDTYTSSTDMEITTTMMRDITSYSTQGTQRTDRVQREAPAITITKEVFTSLDEIS